MRFISIIFSILLITAFLIVLYVFVDQLLNGPKSDKDDSYVANQDELIEAKKNENGGKKYDFFPSDVENSSNSTTSTNGVTNEFLKRIASRRGLLEKGENKAGDDLDTTDISINMVSLEAIAQPYIKDLYTEMSFFDFEDLELKMTQYNRVKVSNISDELQRDKIKLFFEEKFDLTLVENSE